MGELVSAVEQVAGVDPHELSDVELLSELVELRGQIDRLEAAWTARLAVFDARKVFVDDHAPSAASWLRSVCRLSPGDAAVRVRARVSDPLCKWVAPIGLA